MENLTENQDAFDQGKKRHEFNLRGVRCETEPLTDAEFARFLGRVQDLLAFRRKCQEIFGAFSDTCNDLIKKTEV